MKKNRVKRRLFPVILVALILFVSFDFNVSAETTTRTIQSFDSLDQNAYTFNVGTDSATVISSLPESLTATVEVSTETVTKDSDGNPASSYNMQTQNESFNVGWTSSDFNSEVAGDYTFTSTLQVKGYTLSCSMPSVTVTLANTVEAPPEKESPEPVVNAPEEKPSDLETPATNTETPGSNSSNTTEPSQTSNSSEDNNSSNTTDTNGVNGGSTDNSSDNASTSTSSSSASNSSSSASSSSASSTTTASSNISNGASAPVTNTSSTGANNSAASISAGKTIFAAANDEVVADDNKEETAEEIPVTVTNKTETKSEFNVGKGKAVINLEKSKSSDISARITDDETLLRNILTDEQLKRVAEGATVNLKITTDIVSDSDISKEDAEKIDKDLEEYRKDIPGLCIAGYVDISIYLSIDDEDWSYVSNTNKPVELVINVPDSMKGLSSSYYIMRLHDGETTLFNDNDDDPDTVTISTGKFSIYVIMYDSEAAAEIEKTEKNEMNLLIVFVIILVVVLLVQIVYIFAIRKKLHSVEQ